jgi:hypothetical protein
LAASAKLIKKKGEESRVVGFSLEREAGYGIKSEVSEQMGTVASKPNAT